MLRLSERLLAVVNAIMVQSGNATDHLTDENETIGWGLFSSKEGLSQ